ncbi:hypothetical protein JCM10207_003640 [Rhodosporidiobolus poonsookiae]
MMGLKALHIPHLSLSRTSSPSRPSSQPATPGLNTSQPASPLSSAPSSATFGEPNRSTPPTSTSSSPQLKPNRSHSPKFRAVDVADENVAKVPRRSSFGASLSAFASRSSSPASGATAAPKSPSVPAGLTLTPATPGRSTSADKSGLRPLRSISGRGKARSKSSDRAHELVAAAPAAAPGLAPAATVAATSKEKKPGMMTSMRRGLALGHSQSQPGTTRAGAALATDGAATVSGGSPVLSSGTATPAQAYAAANGGTPVPSPGAAAGPTGVQLHQLAESYVGKVSLRLGEAVNRVFLPVPTGPGGIPNKDLERAEAPYGGSGVACKGRTAPRVLRAKEAGEMMASELQAALHDPYLLRTLLRSSVLKALSLFLSRLSALLLVPAQTDPSLAPHLFAPPNTLKEADSLPLPLRFNLQIVRCAYEVKHALAIVADPASGFPSFVDETLRPWRTKLAELMGRVMTPLIASARLAVADTCGRARIEGVATGADGIASALELHGIPPATAATLKPTATSSLRSLSLGRASPAPPSGASTPTGTGPSAAAAAAAATAGPAWLRDLSAFLDGFARLVQRLECSSDADKWLVSIASVVTWKGLLNCSARVVGAVGVSSASAVVEPEKPSSPAQYAYPVKRTFLVGAKKSPSPPSSPPLGPADASLATANGRLASAAAGPSPADVAFVRLLSDLELLEARLRVFLSSTLSTPAAVLAPAAPPATACPGGVSCGLCRTGRTFDEESSDSEDDSEDDDPRHGGTKRNEPGRESRLALSAMREAMEALSALIVVVRGSKDLGVIREALSGAPVPVGEQDEAKATDKQEPMTPSALFALAATPAPSPAPAPAATTNATPSTAVTVLPPASSLSPSCPTLHAALVNLPPLILLHLVASRVPPSTGLRLPHQVWALRGGWAEYASELRGFAAGEEWAPEVAWELGGEVERVVAEREMGGQGWARGEREALEVLRVAARRAGGAVPERR